MVTTAPEIGNAVLQTVAVLTSDAGQRENVVLDCLYLHRDRIGKHLSAPENWPTIMEREVVEGGADHHNNNKEQGARGGGCVSNSTVL